MRIQAPKDYKVFDMAYDNKDGTPHILFELLSSAIVDRPPCISAFCDIDWDELRKLAALHGILAVVWDAICRLPQEQQPNKFQKISWELSAQEIWGRYAHQKNVLKEMVVTCDLNNIRLLLLKGIGISELYPQPHSRPSGDLDIYLFEDYEKGNCLFASAEYAETNLHIGFDVKGVHVENHKTFLTRDTTNANRINRYLLKTLDSIYCMPDGYYVLAPVQNLVYLMMHTFAHVNFYSQQPFLNFRTIIDMVILFHSNIQSFSPADTLSLMRKLYLRKQFQLVVYFTEWIYGIELSCYHDNSIAKIDVDLIYELFTERVLYYPIPIQCSLYEQFKHRLARYRRYVRIYKYMPKHKNGFLPMVFREQISVTIKSMMHIPVSTNIFRGIKQKLFVITKKE